MKRFTLKSFLKGNTKAINGNGQEVNIFRPKKSVLAPQGVRMAYIIKSSIKNNEGRNFSKTIYLNENGKFLGDDFDSKLDTFIIR